MEIILEIILTALFEILPGSILQIFINAVYLNFKNAKEYNKTHKALALLGSFLLGSIFGLISYFIYPNRIINNVLFPGISLFISPIIVGVIMKILGEKRIEAGKGITILATFGGGGLFAFSYASIRFLLSL
jgi:hypothetical protein